MSVTAAPRGTLVNLQTVATTGNGLVLAIPASFKRHTVTIQGSAGVGAGAVQLESADSYNYAGTWNPVGGGPVTVAATTEKVINFEGTYLFIRARISSDITGGTVTVTYIGN